jgi:hypothetical protein
MVIFQALITLITNSIGKILNTAFSWATLIFFGKIPDKRQSFFSIMAMAAVVWLVVALGIAFPGFGAFVLAFIPLPEWVDRFWIRMIMLALTLLVPIGVGVLAISIMDKAKRPKTIGAKCKAILRGYPYTFGLALALVIMIVVAPIIKLIDLVRRREKAHIAMIVKPQDYLDVVGDIERVLLSGGFEVQRELAGWMLRAPTKVFTLLVGGVFENMVADQLTVLRAPRIKVLLHPFDLVVQGRKKQVARAKSLIAENLTFTKAYQTWSEEANKMEDRLVAIWNAIKADAKDNPEPSLKQLRAIENEMKTIDLTYEEWEVLFRERTIVERGLLQVMAGVREEPKDLTDAKPESHEAHSLTDRTPNRSDREKPGRSKKPPAPRPVV